MRNKMVQVEFVLGFVGCRNGKRDEKEDDGLGLDLAMYGSFCQKT